MIYKMARATEKQQLIESNAIALKQTRIDCFSVRYYHQSNDTEIIYFNQFNPTIYGIEKLQERKNNMNALQAKLQAMNESNGNTLAMGINSTGNPAPEVNTMTLAEKLAASKQESTMQKADMNLGKFAEVEAMRQTLKDQGNLIADLINGFKDLSKVVYESNTVCALIGKDTKSVLNAINTMAARQAGITATPASVPAPNSQGNPAPATKLRKASDNPTSLVSDQISTDPEYQMIYDIFKSHFAHKFAKSNDTEKMAEFKSFINAIDLYSLQSINDTTRASWQAFRAATNTMLFAPGSMELAIIGLIKLATDLECLKDLAPIVDTKSKKESIARINSKFADTSLIDDTTDNQVNGVIKDFAYWAGLLKVKKDIIAECVSLLKLQAITDPATVELIKAHIADASNGQVEINDIGLFIQYLQTTDFTTG